MRCAEQRKGGEQCQACTGLAQNGEHGAASSCPPGLLPADAALALKPDQPGQGHQVLALKAAVPETAELFLLKLGQ